MTTTASRRSPSRARGRWSGATRRPVLLALATVLTTGACDIPRDPEGTLDRVRGGTLRVGVTDAPPWVVRDGDAAEGVEPELVRRFARSLDADVEWHWGSMADHMEALSHFDLDLVVGSLPRSTAWSTHVGLTTPYFSTRILVAGPPGTAAVDEEDVLDDRPVAVEAGGPVAHWVRAAGADPNPVLDLAAVTEGLVAAPHWRLAELGRDTTGYVLARVRHVMAVPPGENGFLAALENSLRDADVPSLLRGRRGEP